MRRPPSASRDPRRRRSCPSGPESTLAGRRRPAAAPLRGPAWPASGAGGADVRRRDRAGTDAVAGEGALPWSAVGTGTDVGGAGSLRGLGGLPLGRRCRRLLGRRLGRHGPDGGGAELPGDSRAGRRGGGRRARRRRGRAELRREEAGWPAGIGRRGQRQDERRCPERQGHGGRVTGLPDGVHPPHRRVTSLGWPGTSGPVRLLFAAEKELPGGHTWRWCMRSGRCPIPGRHCSLAVRTAWGSR